MAKKRYRSSQSQSFLSRKKIRRWLFRLALVGLGAATGVLARPSLIQDPVKRAQVEDIREQILEANTQGQEKALEVLGDSSEVTQEVIEKVVKVTEQVTHQDPQQIINNTVTNVTNEVKDLPQEQVKKVKLQICEEILKDVDTSE